MILRSSRVQVRLVLCYFFFMLLSESICMQMSSFLAKYWKFQTVIVSFKKCCTCHPSQCYRVSHFPSMFKFDILCWVFFYLWLFFLSILKISFQRTRTRGRLTIDGIHFFKNFRVECKGFRSMIFGGLLPEDRTHTDPLQVETGNFFVL